MTPQQALQIQIERNDRSIRLIESREVDKQLNGVMADEGRAHVVKELTSINDGLREALERLA